MKLFVGEVKVAELFPQDLVLTEVVQVGHGLTQVDDVRGVRELSHDLVLHVDGQVT